MSEAASKVSMRRGRQAGSGGRTAVSLAAVLALPLLLGGCGVWDEFFGEEPQPTRVQVPEASADAETPSFGSIPERRGNSPTAQRQALQSGLQGDRQGASYYQGPSQPPSEPNIPANESGTAAAAEMQGLGSAPASQQGGVPPQPQPRAGFEGQAQQQAQQQAQPRSTAMAGQQMNAAPQMQSQFQQQQALRRELVGVIYFAHGSSNLDNRDREVLRQVKSMLQGTGGQLRVVGHASMRTGVLDPAEHARANFEISQQRAASVANELNRMGVPDAALVIDAIGAQQPVFYEFMPTGEAGNRRVEIYLEY
jgi:outer membrane protein OmpA-like peptidoglycan-associated protein